MLQEVGVLDRLLPTHEPGRRIPVRKRERANCWCTTSWRPASAVSGWEASYMFVQPGARAGVCAQRLGEIVGVTTWYGSECVDLAPDRRAVEVDVRDRTGDCKRFVRALADRLRRRVELRARPARGRVEDLGFDEPWVVIDTKLKRDIGLARDNRVSVLQSRAADHVRAGRPGAPSLGVHAVARRDARDIDREPASVWQIARTVGWRGCARSRARRGVPIPCADRARAGASERVLLAG